MTVTVFCFWRTKRPYSALITVPGFMPHIMLLSLWH